MKSFICFALLIVVAAAHGGKHHGRHFSTTEACLAAEGTCFSRETPEECDSKTSIAVGSCDEKKTGCCLERDEICAHFNGTCGVAADECAKTDGMHASHLKCSDESSCCMPIRKHKKHHGRRHHRHHRFIKTTEQCQAKNGTCSTETDCDKESNFFVGKCDNAGEKCCLGKDEVCENLKGECMEDELCAAKKGYRSFKGFTCAGSEGVCCLPRHHRKHGKHGKHGKQPQ